MKSIIFLLFLMSCSHDEKKLELEHKVVENVVPPIPIVVEQNLDLKYNLELSKIWPLYFSEDFSDTKSVNVLVVTNRNLKKNNLMGCSDEFFGTQVSKDKVTKNLLCKINVPKKHTTGEIQKANNERESSHENFKVLGVKSVPNSNLYEFIKKSNRTPLVFVHGFNVKLEEAIYRASQIAFDLKYQGPVIVFSWPAGSEEGFFEEKLLNRTYVDNFNSAKSSINTFKFFLEGFQKNNLKLNLLVHSMGHQVVLPALAQLQKVDNNFINELILNAPDFEVAQFGMIAEKLTQISKRVTLYCSYNDNAMIASEFLNKNKRLGACSNFEGIDSINVSLVDAPKLGVTGLGHGYYASRPILSDVFQVMLGIDAEKRLFIRKSETNSTEKYYLYP